MSSPYGALVPGAKMSFTELEYNLALEGGLVILAFLPDARSMAEQRTYLDLDSSWDRAELASFKQLEAFRKRVSQNFYSTYKPGDDFKYIVSLALHNGLKDLDRPGLIRSLLFPRCSKLRKMSL